MEELNGKLEGKSSEGIWCGEGFEIWFSVWDVGKSGKVRENEGKAGWLDGLEGIWFGYRCGGKLSFFVFISFFFLFIYLY